MPIPSRQDSAPTGETARKLADFLTERGLVSADAVLAPLSGGRTNTLWRVPTTSGDQVVKLFAPTPDNPLFGNDPTAEAQMLSALAGHDLAPRLNASLDTPFGPVILYDHAPGSPWHSDPAPVAQTLRRLHTLAPPTNLPHAPDGSAELTRQTLSMLDLCAGPKAERLRNLQPKGAIPPSRAYALLHGDAVPGNIIAHDGRITLIDWQCPAIGDPVHDLALFLSPAMQRVYRGTSLSPEEEQRFLAEYASPEIVARYRALAPWFHWRMAAYCLWRVTRGAGEYRQPMALECAKLPA